jgi:hypothetical protein
MLSVSRRTRGRKRTRPGAGSSRRSVRLVLTGKASTLENKKPFRKP